MFGIGGRKNEKAWANALFENSSSISSMPDKQLLEQLTEQQVNNDCRIILESIKIVQTTPRTDTKEMRLRLASERYAHLMELKPFADTSELSKIKEVEKKLKSIRRTRK